MSTPITWSYGVTTVPERREELLPRTLRSLGHGGFDQPHLFVDGVADGTYYHQRFKLGVTCRYPGVYKNTPVIKGSAANWVLSLYELYYRNPNATYYAVFQDDFVCYKNFRQYLERCCYPDRGYLNCYSFPSNESLANGKVGWYPSNQCGKGAVALIFSNEAVTTLLSSDNLVHRPKDASRGHRAIDGGIVDSFKKLGWREFVHYPSLVQHTGYHSSMFNEVHKTSNTFRGEEFDALNLVKEAHRV